MSCQYAPVAAEMKKDGIGRPSLSQTAGNYSE
jgi:reverse gyrase